MKQFSLCQSLELCEWLVTKGLGMGECAHLITDMEIGDSFGMALLKVFKRRELMEKQNEKSTDWGVPLTG
jgi:hypothetical protein